MPKVISKILRSEEVQWRDLAWLQGELKEISKESFNKLKRSIIKNQFIAPFHVWEDESKCWILDGHHRMRALQELEKEGYEIPDTLPANFIKCDNIREAKKLILIYSSIYAMADEDSLYAFLNQNEIAFNEVKEEIHLPDVNLLQFESFYFKNDVLPGTLEEQSLLDKKNPVKCPECGAEFVPKG